MKTGVVLLALFFLTGMIETASGDEGGRRVGFVDLDRVFRAYPPAAEALGGLEEELKEKEAEIERLLGEIRRKRAESELLSDQARARAEQEISRKTFQLRQYTEEAEIEINRRLFQKREKLLGEIFDRISVFARAEGYDYILRAEAAAFLDPALDITDRVVEFLQPEAD